MAIKPSTLDEMYKQLLEKKLDIEDLKTRLHFNALPHLPIPRGEPLDIFYSEIETLARQAIEQGNYESLQSLVGPEIYNARHITKQKIMTLIWELINTIPFMVIYASLFNYLVDYARQSVNFIPVSNSNESNPLEVALINHLKVALKNHLKDTISLRGVAIQSIVNQIFDTNSEDAIINHVLRPFYRQEINKDIGLKIDDMFSKAPNLKYLLKQFYQLWNQHYEKVQQLEKRYENLVNESTQLSQRTTLETKYRELPAVQKFSNKRILSVKEVENEILEWGLGEFPLSELSTSLLSLAVEQCKRKDLSESEHAKRISIVTLLIRKGCSLLSLPEYSLASESKSKKPYLAWPLIIETLSSLLCITPTAIAIREACLEYAKEDHSISRTGMHRALSVFYLIQLIHESQSSINLSEDQLLEAVKEQIAKAPRGLMGGSSLYGKLEKIINDVKSQQLIAIKNGDPIEPNEHSEVDAKPSNNPDTIISKIQNYKYGELDENISVQLFRHDCFKLVSLEEYHKSLQKQESTLRRTHDKLINNSQEHISAPHLDRMFDDTVSKDQPSPIIGLAALQHRIDLGEFDHCDKDFWTNLLLMPDIFGDYFSKGISNKTILEKKNLTILRYHNNPLNILKRVKESNIADSYEKFSNKNHKISEAEAIPYIYLHQCDQRSEFSIKQDIDHRDPHNLLGRVEWAILSKMIQEHREVIQRVSNDTPNQLVYFNETVIPEKGLWIFNKNAAEPLMIRMELVANLFNFRKQAQGKRSHSSAYLQLFKEKIIEPLYREADRLAGQIEPDTNNEHSLKQYKALLESIEKTLSAVLLEQFKKIKEQTLTNDINAVLNLEGNAASSKIELLQARRFDDKKLIIKLHDEICQLLRKYQYDENNKTITQYVESLKKHYFKALTKNFMGVVKIAFNQSRLNLMKKLKNIQKDENYSTSRKTKNENHLFSGLLDNDLLSDLRNIERNKKENYVRLTEKVQTISHLIKIPNQQEAGQKICNYASKLPGHASWKWKASGASIIILGVGLAIFGGLCLISGGGVMALGALVGYTLLVSGAVVLPSTGVGLFAYGRQKGFSNSTYKLGKILQETNPVTPQARA